MNVRPFSPPPRLRGFFAFLLSWGCLLASPVIQADSIATAQAFVPVIHQQGGTGFWQSDINIFNPEMTRGAVVDIYYTPHDTDGSSSDGVRLRLLGPRQTWSFTDILCGEYFSRCQGDYGLLEIRGSTESGDPLLLIVTSSTYNTKGAVPGTYGQFVPGQPGRKALGFDPSEFGELYAIGLPSGTATHQVNAAIMNPSRFQLDAVYILTDARGFKYPEKTMTVPPFSMSQVNDIFGKVFAAEGPFDPKNGPYRLTFAVNRNNGARILAYVTVTDTRTGDPYLITADPNRP